MKLFGKKSISSSLYWITGFLTLLFLVGFLFVAFSVLFDQISVNDANEFSIVIPLTELAFKGMYNAGVFTALLLFLAYYSVFFFGLFAIFRSLQSTTLFTDQLVKYLLWFALLNIIFPPLYTLAGYMLTGTLEFSDVMPSVLHFILGIFSLFIRVIFKQGFQLQQENDLTI